LPPRISKATKQTPIEDSLKILNRRIVECRKCPRLVKYRENVAHVKRRAYREQVYWGRPVPGFGDARAKLLIIGLAPGAHGANRTGRMFTGDRSGEFLYARLYSTGFANQPTSVSRTDGLVLKGAYINAVARCAPPDNKPTPDEICNCSPYLEEELDLLKPRAILALGQIAWTHYLRVLHQRGNIDRVSTFKFSHGANYAMPSGLPRLFGSYHPSQQNTQTGRLTPAMFARVLKEIRSTLDEK
jgi:uracil-DNA glycosylase